jgi:hypothetical protein
VDDSAGIGSGHALRIHGNGSSSSRRVALGYDLVTLTGAGDFISIQFDARHLAPGGDPVPVSDRDWRFGLYHQGALITDDDYDGNSKYDTLSDDVGYYVQVDTGQGAGTGGGLHADVRIEFNTDGSPLTGNESSGDSESFGADTDDARAALTEIARNYRFTITLEDPADPRGVRFELDVDGDNLIRRSLRDSDDAADLASTLRFDGFLIGQNGTDLDTMIDNVVIRSNVPEPGSLSLMAMAGLALVRRRHG